MDSNVLATVADYHHYNSPCGMFLAVEGYEFETDPDDVDFLVELTNDHGNPVSTYI